MAWKGVITNAGDALLKKWPSGGVLELCRAAAGTGRVEEALLMAQTSLVNEKQEMGILSTTQTDDGPKLKLRLNVPEEGFALSQYGVWAKLDGGEAVLLAIYQNDADIPIPSVSEEPDFEYVMYATICFTNLGELTVTIKPSTTVSKEDMDEYVEGYVANALAPVQEKLDDHVKTVSGNPHKVTAAEVGLGNVPNVATNDQMPTYTVPATLTNLSSGEKLATAMGKIAKAVKDLITHIGTVTGNPHKVTAAEAGAVPTSRKVNGKALSSDITLGAADVGAAATNHGTHVTYSTAAPKGAGTASAGTEATVARSDHVHPAQTSVTGSSGSCTGNAETATKAGQLTTARNIFGRSFNGTADIAGKATMYGHYTATVNNRYGNSALEIRENDQVGTGQSDIGYAPSIGFHWSGRVAGTLAMGVDAIFRFLTQSGGRATVDANLNGNAVTATTAGSCTGNAATASSLAQNAGMTYGWSGLQYFNASLPAGNAAKVNDGPAAGWYHIIRVNHSNPAGYYVDLALPLTGVGAVYYKYVSNGAVQNGGWVKLLDAKNFNDYAPTKAGVGASGTWDINITGNAKTATTATSAGSCTGNAATATNATNHINNKNNPHGVTLSQLGGCRIQRFSYTGTGTYGRNNPCRLTFNDFVPKVLFIAAERSSPEFKYAFSAPFMWNDSADFAVIDENGKTIIQCMTEAHGSSLPAYITWYAENASSAADQLNTAGEKYVVLAIG